MAISKVPVNPSMIRKPSAHIREPPFERPTMTRDLGDLQTSIDVF